MAIKNIIPWKRKEETETLAPRRLYRESFLGLQGEINRLFENFFSDFGLELEPRTTYSFTPRVDVTESDQAIEVAAELPGLEEKDVEVTIEDGALLLRGEKSSEHEETKDGVHRIERSYGSFYRRVPIPVEVKEEGIAAVFHQGVLKVTLPKTAVKKAKTIEVKAT